MAVEDERSGRGRMDRSLDEIAAEMHSDQHEVFGRGYEHRELGRMTHRERESRRYEPYSSRRDGHDRGGPSWRAPHLARGGSWGREPKGAGS